jgi:regulator of protease activity HflC (stomatin/prohibitin superfamily)
MNIDSFLELVAILAWIVAITFGLIYFLRNSRRYGLAVAVRKMFTFRVLVLYLLIPVTLTVLSMALVFIEPHEVGVVVSIISSKGIRSQPFESGLHWIVPLAERVVRYPIYWQTYTMSIKPLEGQVLGDDTIVARTADGQEVSLDCSVIFRIDPDQVIRVHIDWQDRYIQDLVRPTVRGIMRTLVSAYTVDEVNSNKRQDLETSLDTRLRTTLEDKGFVLDQFVLRNIAFSPEYASSVEEKQVALQGAIQKEYQAEQIRKLAEGRGDEVRILAQAEAEAVVIKAQANAEARVIQAQAEAKALDLISVVLIQNPDLLTYRYIEKLSPAIRAMLVPNNVPYILPLPTMEPEAEEIPPTPTPLLMTTPSSLTVTETITETPSLPGEISPTPTATPTPEQR